MRYYKNYMRSYISNKPTYFYYTIVITKQDLTREVYKFQSKQIDYNKTIANIKTIYGSNVKIDINRNEVL